MVPDEQTAWLELQNGRVAFAPVPPDQLPAARTVHGLSPDGRTTPGLLNGPTLTTWQLTFNLKSNLLGRNPTWRQAVSLAIDRDQLAAIPGRIGGDRPGTPTTPGGGSGGAGWGRTRPARCAPTTRPRPAPVHQAASRAPVTMAIPPGPELGRVAAAAIDGDLTPPGSTWRSLRPRRARRC